MENLRVLENELVPVYVTSTGEKVIYGTELYEVLKVKSKFADWVKNRLKDCDALENEDFQSFSKILEKGGRPQRDYIIKLDIAKEMAMLERNAKGKQVRRYFIRVEEKYKMLKNELSRENKLVLSIVNGENKLERVQALSEYKQIITAPLLEKIEHQNEILKIQKPFVQAAIKLKDTKNTVSMEQAAKMLREDGIDIGRNKLMKLLREHKILMENNSPYQKYIDIGVFELKADISDSKIIPVTRVTGKGLIFLNKKLRDWFGMEKLDVEI